MFRGLRGIEAAQEAFDMCGVDIGFHVQERVNTNPSSEGAGRDRQENIHNRATRAQTNPEGVQGSAEEHGDS